MELYDNHFWCMEVNRVTFDERDKFNDTRFLADIDYRLSDLKNRIVTGECHWSFLLFFIVED